MEVWSDQPTSYENLRVLGCIAYAHVRQDKLELRALKCIFIGYPEVVKGYILWCLEPGYKKCLISRDVIFKETEMASLVSKDHDKQGSCSQGKLKPEASELQLEVEPINKETTNKTQNEVAEHWPNLSTQETEDQSDLLDYNLTKD